MASDSSDVDLTEYRLHQLGVIMSAKHVRTTRLDAGDRAGEYRIERHLADGGTASVYAAIHSLIGKHAAVKVLMARNARAVERFLREAQAVNEIQHPNIVDIFAFGCLEDGRQYLVMEYLEGRTLQSRLEQVPLGPAETLDILDQVCDALEATHAHRIAHLDLKPANIYLVPGRDARTRVKLLDFGIAKLLGVEEEPTGSELCCTPSYASPEQALGRHELDERSDVYSLGVMFYEMVCGARPFTAPTPRQMFVLHQREPVPHVSWRCPTTPPGLDELIASMMAKCADERPSVTEVRARLSRLRGVTWRGATRIEHDALTTTHVEQVASRGRSAHSLRAVGAHRTFARRAIVRWPIVGVAGMLLACAALWARHGRPTPIAASAHAAAPRSHAAATPQHASTVRVATRSRPTLREAAAR
jgi:serine/threonine-protein kinase